MWSIRILSGSLAGQNYSLKEGSNKIGRAPNCDFQIQSQGISKEHLEIRIDGSMITLTDLNSSNGTFVNGVRVKTAQLKMGDKISIHNVLLDLVPVTVRAPVPKIPSPSINQNMHQIPNMMSLPAAPSSPGVHGGMPTEPWATPMNGNAGAAGSTVAASVALPKTWSEKWDEFLDQKLMPALHGLIETFEFKMVLLGLMGVFVLVVTMLAVIPMKQITADTIELESRRRAMTVARALAQANEKILRTGDFKNFNTDLVLREDGIDDVYIIGQDGRILAPGERAGLAPKDTGFVQQVRGQTREVSGSIGFKVAAAVPIVGYDSELQQNVARAHAVIVYNPGSMKFDDGRVFGLFVQMLALALMLGGVLFFLLYKLVEYPFNQLDKELDQALREGRDHAEIKVQLPALQKLSTTVNSMLTRALTGPGDGPVSGRGSKDHEMLSLVQLIGHAAILINREGKILKVNSGFEYLTGIDASKVEGFAAVGIPDQAMQKNILHLITLVQGQPQHLASDRLEIGGQSCQTNCQAMTDAMGEIEYYFVTINLASEGAAA